MLQDLILPFVAFCTNFFTQLLIPFLLFGTVLKRRKFWYLPAAIAALLDVVIYFFFSDVYSVTGPFVIGGWFNLSFLLVFIFVLVLFGLSVKVRFKEIVFYGSSAYAMQNAVHNLSFAVNNLIGNAFREPKWYLVTFVLMALAYTGAYFLFICRIRRGEAIAIESRTILAISLGTIAITYILSMYFLPTDSSNTIARIYAFLCCVFLLFVQFNVFDKSVLQQEKNTAERLMYQEQRQYAMWRENVDIINQKCHDLKHQIAGIRHMTESVDGKKSLKEIENAVMIYETTVVTGNSTLDSILTEKCLYCEKNDIRFSCIADAKKLSFMSDVDICTLFGNALDNAIESVMQVKERERRVIGMNVSVSGNMMSIHLDNSYDGIVEMRGDFPVTSKKDKAFHGYGVKSMRAIVERYDGQMKIKPSEGIFNLDILFFLKEGK